MTTSIKAPIDDQKKVMLMLLNLECPQDMQNKNVREQDLILAGYYNSISEPEECINELIAAGFIYRASGGVIKRTEATG